MKLGSGTRTDLVAKTSSTRGLPGPCPRAGRVGRRGRSGRTPTGALAGFGVNTRLPGADLSRLAALADWLMERGIEVGPYPGS